MTEISKDFLKLIATLIVVLTIFVAILNSGILESLFALKTYAEPLTLLDHLAAAIETASSCPGECSFSVRTSGLPYILEIYKENGNYYASIDASLVEEKSNVKFLPNQQKPVFTKPLVSDCIISEQKLAFTEGLIQDITIKKVFEGGTCKVFIESKKEYYDFNVSVDPDTLLVLNGTSSTTMVTVSLVGSQIAPGTVSLTVMGAPPSVTITLDKNDANPTFTSTMTVTANPNAVQGIYNLTIIGTSGNLARTAYLQIEVSPTLYTFILNSEISILKLPLTKVGVNLNGITKYTRQYDEFTSNIIYGMIPGSPYSVKVDNPFADPQGPRPFSHFRDFDCKGNNTGYILDTGSNPYPFGIPNDWKLAYSRKMTAFYKDLTQIRNLEFDNLTNTISGNLLDEDFNSISKEETSYATCNVSTKVYPNRNVNLYYLSSCTNTWQPIFSVVSSFAGGRFYDKFDKDNNNWGINDGNWNITNGELNNSGIGYESIQTKWNFWNSSSDGNNNLEVSVKLLSGNNVSIRVFDAINDYYLQTNDSYNNIYLWVNGALGQNVSLTGINPNQWNIWRIKQNESYIEFYLNNKKLIRYNGVPVMGNGRIEIRTYNTQAHFDNITAYDGSWSYHINIPCSAKKIRAVYVPTDWYYDGTSSEIDLDPMAVPCKLTVNSSIDALTEPLPDVEVNVTDGVLNKKFTKNTSGTAAIAEFLLAATPLRIHSITVNDTFNSRNFSHFFDQDCDPLSIGHWLDDASNPYWFSICRDKNITIQYKTFTNITDFKFDFHISSLISGKLLDERNNPLSKQGHTQPTCDAPDGKIVPVNRNVTLEYFKKDRWYYINATDSKDDGSWSYDWGCKCNATKLRANYTPLNWWYMPNSTEIDIICPCDLTVITQIDVFDPQPFSKLSPVKVNVSNKINWTDTLGIAVYSLFPGTYYINVDNPFNSRPFSHFWDNDCNRVTMNYYLDNVSNPYDFGMYDREKNITAQYKAFTKITDSLLTSDTFEFNGTTISGKLLDERNGSLIGDRGSHPSCENPLTSSTLVPVNRNVTLEYFDGSWHYIGVVDSQADGNWSYDWNWIPSAKKLRANYTPLSKNWFYVGTSVEISIYKLTVDTVLDLYAPAPVIPNVQVTVDKITKSSGASGIAQFFINPKKHNINVSNPYLDALGLRNFSHFWDHDCDNSGNNWDTNANPYTFTTWEKDRNITAFYKTFTYIKDSASNKNKFDYDGATISGKLHDEFADPIATSACKAPVCGVPGTCNPMYRNITLDYYNGTWYTLGSIETSTVDGSWSYPWTCSCNTTKIRASYNHADWYYNSTSAEINVDPLTCPCKLTVYAFKDIPWIPIPNVQENLDALSPQFTDISGKTEFMIKPGMHALKTDLLSNTFSHFWDHDCDKNNLGWFNDSSGSPAGTYNFEMYRRNREITSLYKTFTYMKNYAETLYTFEFNGTHVKGKLLDETGKRLESSKNYHPTCESPAGVHTYDINRNVTLEVYNSTDSKWYPICVVDSDKTDGSWLCPWSCTGSETKLRANYTSLNWYYMSNSTEIPISCMGTLDVYAFAFGIGDVVANVSIGLGDVNWDSMVNATDGWFYDFANPNSCFGTVPGDPKWDLDCDMDLNGVIDATDIGILIPRLGENTRVNKTHFTVNVVPGTYQLRAKYDNQIKNNLSVVVTAGQTTKVNFTFVACDGFTALSCNVPPLANPGDQRVWLDNVCGRTAPSYAKTDCDGAYNSHKICNLASPSSCVLINPTITSYSVSSTTVNVGNPFTVTVNGNCPNALPNDLPGKCLIECNVLDPTYKKGMWHFDEGSGTIANDASGNHNAGTINGATWQAAANCHSGTCLLFDGVNDYVDVPTKPSLDITNTITVEAWIKPNAHVPWARIVSKGNYPNYAYILLLGGDAFSGGPNNIGFVVKETGTSIEYGCYSPTNSISIGSWNHVLGVYNGTHIKVIINDQEKCSIPFSGTIIVQPGNLAIGRDAGDAGYFNGIIDEVKVATKDYDRAITLDTWSATGYSATSPVTCAQEGEYVVDYCAVATDFVINRGWSSLTHTDTIVKCVPSCDMYDKGYIDTDNTPPQIQCSGYNYLSYTSANQIRDYSFNGTSCDCNVTFDSYITSNCIKGVCSGDSSVLSSEYANITTSIKNTGKNAQTKWYFGVEIYNVSDYNDPWGTRDWNSRAWAWFDGNTKTSGCNNAFGAVSNCGCAYSEPSATKNGIFDVGETIDVSCWIPASYWSISTGNRRVMFWSNELDSGQDTNNNGAPGEWWNDALSRKEPSEMRAKIEAPTPFTFTFNSQVDVTGEKLPGIEVNIDGSIKYTSGADAVATYQLMPRTYSISVKNPDGGRYFSHFYDNNCDNLGNAWDKTDNPFTFTMFSNNKGMTAQYKTFTKIKSSSGGTIDNFDGTSIVSPWIADCGAIAEAILVSPGYAGSGNALRIRTTATGTDNQACGVSSVYHNAVIGKKINYACYGGRCALCVWGGSACLNNPVDCGYNIGNWTMCQTTITSSNPNTWIYIYNDNTLGGWSVYDLIEESTFDYDGKTVSGKLLDETNNVLYQVGGKSPNCGGARQIIPIDRNINLEYYDSSWHSIGSPKFYDDFNDGDYNGWTATGIWSAANGELTDSGGGGGQEYIDTVWSGWNSNDYATVNVKILSGNDLWVKIFDGSNGYYFQTWDGYSTLHLYVNGVETKSVALSGITPTNWNIWKINQTGNTIEVYINNQKWMDYNSAPIITNGKIQLRNSNPTQTSFDDVNVDGVIYYKDGNWSYPWNKVSGATILRATYNPSNWYYNYTSAQLNI